MPQNAYTSDLMKSPRIWCCCSPIFDLCLEIFEGWLQILSMRKLRSFFNRMQDQFSLASLKPMEEPLNWRYGSYPIVFSEINNIRERDDDQPMDQIHEDRINLMRVSDRLINSGHDPSTSFLSPCRISGKNWSIATWRAW